MLTSELSQQLVFTCLGQMPLLNKAETEGVSPAIINVNKDFNKSVYFFKSASNKCSYTMNGFWSRCPTDLF